MQPRIGASGGISGLLAYFALRFPGARFGFMLPYRFIFIKLPAVAFIILWLFLMIMNSLMASGQTDIHSMSLMGGILSGIGLWFIWRNRERPKKKPV
jgi:membrane associated rhomboid family serine protease